MYFKDKQNNYTSIGSLQFLYRLHVLVGHWNSDWSQLFVIDLLP